MVIITREPALEELWDEMMAYRIPALEWSQNPSEKLLDAILLFRAQRSDSGAFMASQAMSTRPTAPNRRSRRCRRPCVQRKVPVSSARGISPLRVLGYHPQPRSPRLP